MSIWYSLTGAPSETDFHTLVKKTLWPLSAVDNTLKMLYDKLYKWEEKKKVSSMDSRSPSERCGSYSSPACSSVPLNGLMARISVGPTECLKLMCFLRCLTFCPWNVLMHVHPFRNLRELTSAFFLLWGDSWAARNKAITSVCTETGPSSLHKLLKSFSWRMVWPFLTQVPFLTPILPKRASLFSSWCRSVRAYKATNQLLPSVRNEMLFFGTSLACFSVKLLTFDLTWQSQEPEPCNQRGSCIWHNIKRHVFSWTGYLSLSAWVADQPFGAVTCLEHKACD